MIFQWLLALLFITPSHPGLRPNVQLRLDHNETFACQQYQVNCTSDAQPPGLRNMMISTDSLTVYVFLLDECVISQFYTLQLTAFYEKYHSQKVGFIGYFPNFSSKPQQIEDFAEKYHLTFPLKQDYYKEWTKKFGITVTPEVAVWDHRDVRLIYRGRIDDSFVRVGKRKLHPQNEDLKDIIESWLAGQTPQDTMVTQAIGCFINFTDPLTKN